MVQMVVAVEPVVLIVRAEAEDWMLYELTTAEYSVLLRLLKREVDCCWRSGAISAYLAAVVVTS